MKYLSLLVCLVSSASCFATSFDCGKASNPAEKAICGDKALGAQDEQLARRYRSLRESLPQEEADKLRQEQMNWINERNKLCGAEVSCLRRSYNQRLARLSDAQTEKTESSFAHLARFNDEKYDSDEFMRDRSIQRALKELMGPGYRKFKEATIRIEVTDPLVGSDGVLRAYGAVPHAYTVAETALIVKPSGLIYVAVLEDGKRVLYYTNDKPMARKLPEEFTEWSSRFRDLPIVYKSQ